jgi:hypothetical protein
MRVTATAPAPAPVHGTLPAHRHRAKSTENTCALVAAEFSSEFVPPEPVPGAKPGTACAYPCAHRPRLPPSEVGTINLLDAGRPTLHEPCSRARPSDTMLAAVPRIALRCQRARCEVSERAMHHLSPHGPCEPSTRLTGRARTYTTDLPKWDSTLPEAASERDHRSPHIRIVSPTVLGSLLHIVTRIRPICHDPRA